VLNHKHLGFAALRGACGTAARLLLRGQTNFLRMMWKFDSVFDPALQLADHAREVRYELPLPPPAGSVIDKRALYIHRPSGRRSRTLDDATETFVDATRSGAPSE